MKSATSIAPVQVGKFLSSGGISTTLHWLLMALLIGRGIHATTATCRGALAGAALNYLLQYHWAFATHKPHGKTFAAYVITVIISAALKTGLFHLLALNVGAGIATAQIAATAFVAALNFIFYKRVVFHERIA